MKKPGVLVAMDGQWLLHRAWHASSRVEDLEAQQRVIARQLTAWAFVYGLTHQAEYLMMAFDGGECFRYDVWPEYKISRKTIVDKAGERVSVDEARRLVRAGVTIERESDSLYEAQKATMAMLRRFSIPVVHLPQFEADDCLASAGALRRLHPERLRKVVLVAKDKDTIQSIEKGVLQWYPHEDRTQPPVTLTHEDLAPRLTKYVHADAAGWTPQQFRAYQILTGDSIDDIPQIVSPGKARKIVNEYGTLRAYFATDEGSDFYYQRQADLQRNHRLIVMRTDLFEETPLDNFYFNAKEFKLPQEAIHSRSLSTACNDYVGWRAMTTQRSLF